MYRLLAVVLEPFTLALVLTALATANLWRKRVETRKRLLFVAIPLAALAVLSTPAVSYLAVGSLEWAYPPQETRPEGIDAIVVLSGSVRPPDAIRREAELGEDTLYRCLHAAHVYSQGKPCLVVASGGKVDPDTPGPTLAEAMGKFLVSQGVAGSDLLLEDRSSTTYENAVNTAQLLRARGIDRIILVTDATSMPRAERCFRAQGIEVFPSGCDYHATQFRWSVVQFLPTARGAKGTVLAAHEWLGLAWYWLRGRI